ncbi:head maturation protease [Geobacillus phage GBK2]|uniref:head maturation protease n=1 Tax=Geobacillus phage GBK2 TaxID=1458842 RepID=UPI0003F1EEB4|nr:head maturation protease [Geobacillus phage GBK2]AHJ88602.1 prohead protein [Geobacillus phage GBK2]
MREMEFKNFRFEVKATDDYTFEGYAAVFRNMDSYRDVIEPGAFTKTIKESKRVKVLWQHDPWQPIGKPVHMEEDTHGLYVKAKISNTQLGKDVIQLIKDGVIDELSIGYNTIKDEWDKKNNIRRIKEVKLWEFSPVTFAANDQAIITGAKGLTPSLYKMQQWIDDELKAGRVLSDANRKLVEQAIEALTALLNASEGKNYEPPKGTHNPDDEEKAAEEILKMLQEMQHFAQKH